MKGIEEHAQGTANEMAEKKESVIKKAIDHYFKGLPWDESILEELGAIDYISNGTETFRMGQIDLVTFGIMGTNISIDNEQVITTYNQPYTELYEPWVKVLHAHECGICDMCGEPLCRSCDEHYADCPCPGPHQEDEYDYEDREDGLYARKLERKLTDAAWLDRDAFDLRDDGCSCHINPPCDYCTDPGNPANQEEDDECWEPV